MVNMPILIDEWGMPIEISSRCDCSGLLMLENDFEIETKSGITLRGVYPNERMDFN